MHPSDPNQAEITRLLEVLGASERWLMEGLVGNGWDISRQGKVEHLTGPEGELVVKWLGQEIEWRRKLAGKRRQTGDRNNNASVAGSARAGNRILGDSGCDRAAEGNVEVVGGVDYSGAAGLDH